MRYFKGFILFLIVASFSMGTAFADCRGCCSGHGGTACVDGVTKCKDGSQMSAKCQEKCDKCGGSGAVSKPSSSTPASVPAASQPATSSPSTKSKPGAIAGNTSNDSFNKSKKILERQVYADHRVTFYCGCPFDSKKQVLPCGNFKSKSGNKRAKQVEWEHVVAANHFGQSFPEWRDGDPQCVDGKGKAFRGRKCAEKMNLKYRYMQSDMYNLYPAIGEVNGLRSNYRFDMIAGEARDFGACDMEISGNVAEPPERIRGDIARTYKYMEMAYPGQGVMSRSNVKLFDAWDKQDPVDEWECERCKRIEAIQGNENPVVKGACQEARLW